MSLNDDKKLESSKRNLVATSLVLLAMNMAQAQLSKVNGLIFELTFETPERLINLLALAVVFLMVRYYSHAYKYHKVIYNEWTRDLISDSRIWSFTTDGVSGIANRVRPKEIDIESSFTAMLNNPPALTYKRRLLFNGQIIFEPHLNQQESCEREQYPVSILDLWKHDKSEYFSLLGLVMKYWLRKQLQSPDSLYLFAPYLIGLSALLSFLVR